MASSPEVELLSAEQNGVSTLIHSSNEHAKSVTNLSTHSHANKLTATIKSIDGKFHRIVFNSELKTLEFTLLKNDSKLTNNVLLLTLNEVLTVRSSKIKLRSGLPKGNVVAPSAEQLSNKNSPPNAIFLYYAFRRNIYLWRVREAILYFTTTTEKKQWLETLSGALKEIKLRPKKLMIFINPFGGKGRAKDIYYKDVEPFLDMVGVERTVIETQRANHAYDYVKVLEQDAWEGVDGVVSVGGDGLFNEILSSTIIRTQEESGKNIEDPNVDSLVTPRIRLGIIGAGSANSIVSSVHGVDDCPTAAIHIAIGSKCHVDVCTVHEENHLLRISANAISYGWLGDVLHDSESYRCLGPIRYQYSALRTSIRHPTYFGRVSFALSHLNDERQVASVKLPKCNTPCGVCDGNENEENYPFHWQTDFTHVICCVIPCVSPFTPYGLAPYAGVADGSMDLALVPKVSRFENLQIMRKVSMYGGKGLIRLTQNNLYVFRVSRWKFTPSTLLHSLSGANTATTLADGAGGAATGITAESSESNENATTALTTSGGGDAEEQEAGAWNLDGEILPQPARNSLHFRLHEKLINYFGRELDLDDPRYQKCLCCSHPKSFSKIVVIG